MNNKRASGIWRDMKFCNCTKSRNRRQHWNSKLLIFLDTEFTGLDQSKPDLISIGLVDENGREFYAELPESHWTVQCNEWVHFNVLPHLWGGNYVQSVATVRERLTAWIEAIPDECRIVTDCPDVDFFGQLKQLLSPWPENLNSWPIQFSAWSLGDEREPELRKMMITAPWIGLRIMHCATRMRYA